MHELYQNIASGELKDNPAKAYEMAQAAPVVVLSRTQPRAVIVSPEMWNATAREINRLILRIEELEDSVEVWRGLYELEMGKDNIVPANIADLEKAAGRVPA